MAALIGLLLAAGLGFGLGWLVRSSGRRVIDIELPAGDSSSTAEVASEEDTTTEPKGK
jgi:hypothetical protein